MKVISIDFWDTLCKSNPEFKRKQFDLISQYIPGITRAEWKNKIRECKEKSNHIVETTGKHLHRDQLYKEMFPSLSQIKIDEFIEYSNDLFLRYPPIRTKLGELVELWRNDGDLIYVSSNTVFIHGDTLSEIIYEYFGIVKSNCRFSDEVGYSKPHLEMFNFPLKPNFHIGDNPVTDGACEKAGIKYVNVATLIDEHKVKVSELKLNF